MAKIDWKEINGEKWYRFNSDFDKFKYHFGHWVTIILFFVVLIFVLFTGNYLIKNKVAFTENPLTYGIKQIGEQNDGIAYCSCTIERPSQDSLFFLLNESGFYNSPQVFIGA